MRLHCFPYAGGSAALFVQWSRFAPAGVEIVPIVLPGRGTRYRESPVETMWALVALLLRTISEADRPFAFFGHSMGALVAFELARALRAHARPQPAVLFVSGCSAPPLFSVEPKIHDLSDNQFIDRLRGLKATPAEVLENREMMELLLPGLRADFTLCETYEYKPSDRLVCPIVAFSGQSDEEVPAENVLMWASETSGPFRSYRYPGGHFFLLDRWREVLGVITTCLMDLRTGVSMTL